MKRRYPALVESKLPYSAPPRVSVFLDRTNLIIDAYARHSLLKVSSGRIEAGLGLTSRPTISGGREVFRGLLWRCRRHWQTMFGASRI